MFGIEPLMICLFLIALLAAFANGALGYGFSSLTVPLALLFLSNKELGPAIILIELVVNAWVVLMNRQSLAEVSRRVLPILFGLIPGILIGATLLANTDPARMKIWTYAILLPLILLQAAGIRRHIKAERGLGAAVGLGVGTLYATTTISGPPLALMFNNQGFTKENFRAALGLVRSTETVFTVIVYFFLGLFTRQSLDLLLPIAPAVLIGLPLGAYAIRYLHQETFRRVCMSFDAWIVGFGLSRSIVDLELLGFYPGYAVWLAVIAIDLALLYRYFNSKRLLPTPVTVEIGRD